MSTVIYLSGQNVRAAVGKIIGNEIMVLSVCSADAPEGSIAGGKVVQEDVFIRFLDDFWKKNHLPRRDVTLIVETARAVTRMVLVPRLSHKKLMEYLPREFASVERARDPVYTCRVLGEQNGRQRVFAAMAEREFLEQHIRRFRKLGIRIRSVSIGILAELELLDQIPYISSGTCAIQMLEGRNLISILYVGGQYYHFTSTRICKDRGTPEFGIEAARAISSMRQFLQSQNREEAITQIYLGGDFGEADLEVCRESMLQMDQGLMVDMLHRGDCERLSLAEGVGEEAFSFYFSEIAGLLAPRDRSGLLYQYAHSPERLRRRRELFGWIMPTAAAGTMLLSVILVQILCWLRLGDQLSGQMEYMGNPAVVGHVLEYGRLELDNEMLQSRQSVVSAGLDHIHSYPVYTTRIKDAIRSCGAGRVTVRFCSFEAASGAVTVEAEAEDSAAIHQFVNRLEEQAELFERIHYEGFQFDDRNGVWKTRICCCLNAETCSGDEEAVS